AALRRGQLPAARSLLEESLELRRELGDQDGIASSLHGLGLAALVRDEWTTAHSLFLESLRVRAALGDRGGAAGGLEGLAAVAVASQQPDRAALLLGAAEAQREALGLSLSAHERAGGIDRLAALLSQIGDAAHAGQRQAGRTITLEEALAAETHAFTKRAG